MESYTHKTLNTDEFVTPELGWDLVQKVPQTLQTLPFGVVVLDAQGQIVYFNSTAQSLFETHLNKMKWREVAEIEIISQSVETPYLEHISGKRFYIQTQALPGNHFQLLLIQDMTTLYSYHLIENRKLGVELQYQISSTLSHQVKTPLTAALIHLGQLKDESMQSDQRKRLVFELNQNLRQIEALTDEYLNLIKLGNISVEKISIKEFSERVLTECVSRFVSKKYLIFSDLQNSSQRLVLNWNCVKSAIENLIKNSIDAVERIKPGKISVHVSVIDNEVLVSVRDNGQGVEPDHHENIFKTFYTTKAKGHGLGLSYVKTVASIHGGKVFCKNYSDGFEVGFVLPILNDN